MPQIFQVLKCYKCLVFQIHQTKKSNKFECKMCGEKQSIKRHYGIGTGKDCRVHVQKLNSLRGEIESNTSILSDYDEDDCDEINTQPPEHIIPKPPKQSKWSTFVDREAVETTIEEPMFIEDNEVVLELPRKRQVKKFKVKTKSRSEIEESDNTSMSEDRLGSNWEEESNTDKNVYENSQSIKSVPVYSHVKHNKQVNLKKNQNNQKSPNKQVVLKTVSNNSKWAQFVETQEESESGDYSNDVAESCSKPNNLFSLCDDSDLDNVLDI